MWRKYFQYHEEKNVDLFGIEIIIVVYRVSKKQESSFLTYSATFCRVNQVRNVSDLL